MINQLCKYMHMTFSASMLVIIALILLYTEHCLAAKTVTQGCDENLKLLDLGDATAITLVHHFKVGDSLSLKRASETPLRATKPLCLVKLLVGPGKPGSQNAPSSSQGISINVWLPDRADWNGRYMGYGQGGYAGSEEFVSLTTVSQAVLKAVPAAEEGYVTSNSDDGHSYGNGIDGSFALNEEGKLNWPLLKDWAYRALHVTAYSAKKLALNYYGKSVRYSYWNGQSTGGREGLMIAQRYPDDFDGIVSAYPAINWPSFVPSIMWPQIVMQNDLGTPIAEDKLVAVNAAVIAHCDTDLTGQHDGYIADPTSCIYDPMKDVELLCETDGGKNKLSACLTRREAAAVNKIWYGPRVDGEMKDPASDLGLRSKLQPGQLWYGYNRGSLLHNNDLTYGIGPAGVAPFTIGSDWIAITNEDYRFGTFSFKNQRKKGEDFWKKLNYTGDLSFVSYYLRSKELFAHLNATDSPDLQAFYERGGKIIHWHGLSDNQIPYGGSVHYFEQVKAFMGKNKTKEFYRFYLAPGVGHGRAGNVDAAAPVPGGDANDAILIGNTLVAVVREWVEDGKEPNTLPASSQLGSSIVRQRFWCEYPRFLHYNSGDVNSASSFECN